MLKLLVLPMMEAIPVGVRMEQVSGVMPREFRQYDLEKTREELLQEVAELRQQVAELESLHLQQRQRSQINRQRLNLVLQTSNIGIWFCDLPSLQMEWDAKSKEHFGLPPNATITAKKFLKRLHPTDRHGVRHTIQRAIQERTVCDVTFRLNPSLMSICWIRAIGSVFYDETGQASRFDGITINVTEQKLHEEERDSLLYREQLARETAEAANRVKDEFLGVLSHELRSPLNPILGWSRLLQKRAFDPEITQRALQTIERNAKLQTQLIEDLLDISRILRGKLTLNICAVDLKGVVESALKTVHLAADAKSIRIHTDLASDVGKVAGDPVRLQQIVWNLLSNAIKFTAAEGWVEIKLERIKNVGENIGERDSGTQIPGHRNPGAQNSGVRNPGEQGSKPIKPGSEAFYLSLFRLYPADCAQITIRDTGRGISPEFLPYVFDYFRQANASTTRKFGGLGLGLAIARHLVELHGGAIYADSPGEGQGAIFTVFLPLIQPEAVEQQVEAGQDLRIIEQQDGYHQTVNILPNSTQPASPSLMPLHGVRVLVVDHQLDSREVSAFTLRQFGAETIVARSTREALRAVVHNRPDVLLIDLWTPETDGYRLMQQIRTFPPEQGGRIPAIVLTDYAGEYNQQRALEAGFQLHLPKSVEPETLLAAVVTLVNNSPLR